jgi:hypothetical protein
MRVAGTIFGPFLGVLLSLYTVQILDAGIAKPFYLLCRSARC